MREITFITHPQLLSHDTGPDHPEGPQRLIAIRERLKKGLLAGHLKEIWPQKADWKWLQSGHDEAYLFRFEESALSGRSYLHHPDNQICYDSYDAALLAAGSGITAVDLLESGEAELAFCCVRPPGHHAERALALGFCFLNNVVITARYWQEAYQQRRVAIIDWDAHHGNGIQSAFFNDPSVLYISLHEHPLFSFPGSGYAEETGEASGEGTTINIPLPPATGDSEVLEVLAGQVSSALARFRPERLIVAAGFDGHSLDDMSGLDYSTGCFRQIGERTATWAAEYCGGKVVTFLEGGYQLEALAAGVEAYLTGLACLPTLPGDGSNR
ncbi:MAG: histone deacetylase [Desulfobacteraceae bacterium]|nr:MAG: histone deacetylase [Desulfobacteraceae bacterium]